MDGAKTLSLSSAGAYGPSEAASELQSGVGTSTALDLSATSDELVFEKILTLIKGALVPSQYWLHVLMNKGHNLFLEHFGACIWNHVAIYETHSESDWLAVFLGAGGPRQFIHQAFPIANSRPTQLGDLLRKMVPPAPTQTYCDHYPLPACFPGYLMGRTSLGCVEWGSSKVKYLGPIEILLKSCLFIVCDSVSIEMLIKHCKVKRISKSPSLSSCATLVQKTGHRWENHRPYMWQANWCGNSVQMGLYPMMNRSWSGSRTFSRAKSINM